MSSTISKRQQARNERVLQDLVTTVPGNNFCADCSAPNPSWASWSLGVFLCMRCAAIHRKLGTHISKVKSLSMDSWSNEQVENMRKVGNRVSNRIYNPENLKPSIPIDVDEADSAMERFIRQKYMNNTGSSQRSGSTRLDEGSPPPLPPKGPTKFGMRSASSIFPLGSKSKKQQAAALNSIPSPHLANKPSKVFGASVDSSTDDNERKMHKLREMGFFDTQKNATVLKGVNGNLDRAIETLVRLGGGSSRGPLTSSSSSGLRPSRSLTPLSPNTPATAGGFGLSVDPPHTPASTTSSNNPFDSIPAPPQSSQSTGTMQNKNPYAANTNPFGQPQQLSDFDQAFQNMTIAPTRPLFPNHTGGATTQGAAAMVGAYSTQVPPVPPTPSQYLGAGQTYAFQQPAAPLSAQNTGYNPFLTQQTTGNSQTLPMFPQMQQPQMQMQQPAQTQIPQQNLTVSIQPYAGNHASNPFMRSPTRIQSPALGQIQESQQAMFYASQPVASPGAMATNPFFAGAPQQQQQQQQQQQPPTVHAQSLPYGQNMAQQQFLQSQQQMQAQQQMQMQYAGHQPAQQFAAKPAPTKDSIMALYNYPHLAPQPTGIPQAHQQTQLSPVAQAPQQHPRSVSSPLTGSNNPFANMGSVATSPISTVVPNAAAVPAKPAGSRESIALGMEMAWSNGRHSPDAFSGLSARQ